MKHLCAIDRQPFQLVRGFLVKGFQTGIAPAPNRTYGVCKNGHLASFSGDEADQFRASGA